MFNLNIKVWDKMRNEYLTWQKIITGVSPYYVFANKDKSFRVGWSALEKPKRYVVCFGLGQKDKNGVLLFSGDIVKRDDGETGNITWFENHARFAVKCKGKFVLVETSRVEKIGDIFQKGE